MAILTVLTLAEGLPIEINRCREILDHFKELRGIPNIIIEPQIAMMEAEITAAIEACGAGDVVAMLRSYATLKDYEE